MNIGKHIDFLSALSIILVAVALSAAVYNRIFVVNMFILNMRFSHMLSIIGTIGIAVATPLFTMMKRSYPASWTKITRVHILGNLAFFTLIIYHFASQMSRSNLPDLGTGLGMFVAMSLQIVFGFTQRFASQIKIGDRTINLKTVKFIHASLIMVFYLIILIHVLHGFGII